MGCTFRSSKPPETPCETMLGRFGCTESVFPNTFASWPNPLVTPITIGATGSWASGGTTRSRVSLDGDGTTMTLLLSSVPDIGCTRATFWASVLDAGSEGVRETVGREVTFRPTAVACAMFNRDRVSIGIELASTVSACGRVLVYETAERSVLLHRFQPRIASRPASAKIAMAAA